MRELARNVIIKVGGKAIAGGTDAGLSLTSVFDSHRTKADSYEKNSATRVDWTMESQSVFGDEGDGLADIGLLASAFERGEAVEVEYELGSMAVFMGTALISSYKENAPLEGRPNCSCTFRGVSELVCAVKQL